jgi:phosphate starvation-inducible protein PhoH
MKPEKKDNSPYIPQRDKLKYQLNIRERIPWTEKQKAFLSLAMAKNTRIMFVKGPAGTSKTCASVYASLKLMNETRISDIVYIRAAVESSDAKLGYLPGDTSEKLHFYNLPFMDKLEELLPNQEIVTLEKDKRISMYPVNFARGMNWNAKAIILDESQNNTRKEIMTILTRLGEFSRCFVLADPMQSDLPSNKRGAFQEIMALFDNEESRAMGIHTFEFSNEDIVRSKLVRFLVDKFDKLKPANGHENGNGNGH